jgi:hypothetical protein
MMEHLRGTVAPPFEIPKTGNGKIPPVRARPLVVTAIAIYEFFRASIILLVLLSTRLDPNGYLTSRMDVRILTYVVTRHNVSTYANSIIMPLVAVSVFSIGLGLWFLRKWARNAVMISSGATVVLWLRRILVDQALGEAIVKSQPGGQSVYVVIMIDTLIFSCMALYPDIASAFGEKNE